MINVKLRFLPVDNEGKVLVDNMKSIIKKHKDNIVCAIGLFPNNAFGTADDIEGMSALCLSEKIHFHVDASYGAFQAAFSRDSTLYKKFDFSLPGVSSLSANLSSFAKCPTGICFIGYRNREIRKNHYFLFGKWMGGMYASPTLPGSRVASIVVTSFITFLNLGLGKYKLTSQKNYELISKLKKEINNIGKLKLIGDPIFNVISLCSDKLDILSLYECLKKDLKWDLSLRFAKVTDKSKKSNKKTLESALNLDSISLTITNNNFEAVSKTFIEDLKNAISLLEANPLNYKVSESTIALKEISNLPVEVQNEILADFAYSKFEFKK
jgi:sphinganine-1-phosphate aldolase